MANKTSKERGLGFLTFGPFFSVSNNWLLTECQLYVPWECSSKQDRQPHPWTPRFHVTRASMQVPVGKWRSPSLGSSPVTLLEYLFVFNFMPHKPCLFLLSVLNIHDHKRLRFPNQSSMWATFKQGKIWSMRWARRGQIMIDEDTLNWGQERAFAVSAISVQKPHFDCWNAKPQWTFPTFNKLWNIRCWWEGVQDGNSHKNELRFP